MTLEADDDSTLRHRHFRTARAKKGGSPTLDRIPLLFNSDVAMLYVEPNEADEHFYRNAQADELVYVAKGKGTLETPVRRPAVLGGRLPRDPPRHHAPLPLRRVGRRAEAAGHGGPRARPPAEALPQRVRPAHRGRAVLRARHPRAARAAHARRDGRVPHPREAVRRDQRDHPRPPSARRRGLGRPVLSVGVQHQRLRADRRPRAPAAAGAPDLPGRRVRRLLVLPAAVRLPPARRSPRRTTTATWTRTRCCTTPRASS